MERLCFGTLIDILIACKRETVSKTQLTTTIIGTIDSKNTYNSDYRTLRALNHLYKCTGDFTETYSKIKERAPTTERSSLLEPFAKNVIPLIDEDKYDLLVLSICNIIKNDATLNYTEKGENLRKFERYIKLDIDNFLNANEYILSELLTDIFLYTINEIKNTDGKEWLQEICSTYKPYDSFFTEYVNRFQDKRKIIKVWADGSKKLEQQSIIPQGDSMFQAPTPKATICTQGDSQDINNDSLNDTQTIGIEAFVPAKYHVCNCCDYFHDVAKSVPKSNKKGRCNLYETIVKSTDGSSCEDFSANTKKVLYMELQDKFHI